MDLDLEFCGKFLGSGHPAFVVAEIGFNHNGDVELAKRMIESAAENGADAVKLQTFLAGEMISRTLLANDPDHPGNEIPIYEFFQRYELSRDDYKTLLAYAKTLNIPLFSTPFDDASLDMLVELGVPALKISSPDLTYTPFLERVAETGLPVVLSTGMGSEEEIFRALQALRKAKSVVLLHCVSNYPSRYEEMNLACLEGLRQRFKLPVGLSDHTLDNLSAVVAASLGAVMIEKHYTLDRKMHGVDQSISMQPEDKQKCLKNISTVKNLEEVKAELILEAVVERLDVKTEIFTKLAEINSDDTILATNTSSIPITQIAAQISHPERIIGIHFFNPAHLMKLVEVVSGAHTSSGVKNTCMTFVSSLGKTAIHAKDAPGFIVNRVARHYYVESLKILEEGIADVEQIDKLMEASGFKLGPFRLMDLIGVETNFSVTESMYNLFYQDEKFRPSRIQKQKVDAGHFGRKTGKGFYSYDK